MRVPMRHAVIVDESAAPEENHDAMGLQMLQMPVASRFTYLAIINRSILPGGDA
jgi:hypothetical protein